MKAFKYILLLLLVLIIGFSIYIAVQPNSFEVERSRTMKAPASMVYENIIDFKNWAAWSSWVEADPEMVITLPEKTEGVGGSYSWEDENGIGTMKTLEAKPYTSIVQEMQIADFPASSVVWNLKSNDDGTTEVTWNIIGKDLPFGFKAYATVMGGMDKQIGPHYERSLAKLDSILTADMQRYNVEIKGITEYGGGFFLYKTTNANSTNISAKMAENFGAVAQFMGQQGISQSGMPMTVYNEMAENVIMSNGIPINERIDVPADADVSIGFIPKVKVLKTTLTGNYTNLRVAWEVTMKHIEEKGLELSEVKPFEIYTTDPGDYPNPADWKTEIYIPLKE
ncbi:SRPBCC family protein [Winogradskyella tangerina]|uniref:SRPBCC family protein n=1 Tax=Winogradskyella tangerina TaxID=2023240 RepID=UPI000DBE8E9C|nr:SRPBCC family protein [Winogradskyella tangerina]